MKVDRVVYCFWTGDNPVTPNRVRGVESMKQNFGVPVEFLDRAGIERMILPDAPLHPCFKYLSENHKSDYLRCYFMHHFGGAYSDIKCFSENNNWAQCFDMINADDSIDVIGEHEIPGGSPYPEYNSGENLGKVLVNCWFICRPRSEFTTEWYRRLMLKMEERADDLRKFPATEIFGGPSYKLRWPEMMGEIFHKLCVEKYGSGRLKNCLVSGRRWEIPYR